MEFMEDFSDKCFVIMPISDKQGYPIGHFTKVYEQIFKPAIKEAGYKPYRVDEDCLSSSIIQKIYDGLTKAPMAICDLSSANPNVLYELGIRHSFDLPVILVKDEKTNFIFDISTINTVTYQSDRVYENVISAIENIKTAIEETKIQSGRGTVLSILNVEKAIITEKRLNQEDKTELILNRIMVDLQQIKEMSLMNEKRKNIFKYSADDSNRLLYVNTVINNSLYEDMKNKIYQLKQDLGRFPSYEEVLACFELYDEYGKRVFRKIYRKLLVEESDSKC